MKAVLFTIFLFLFTAVTGCTADGYDINTQDPTSISRHPAELSPYEIPLNEYTSALGLIDMVVTNLGDNEADIVIYNNSDWGIFGDFQHTVEIFAYGKWLTVRLNEGVIFPDIPTRFVPPGDSLPLTVSLPNFAPFSPPYILPLEVGRYRIRRTVSLIDAYSDEHIATHELVAEFYITD